MSELSTHGYQVIRNVLSPEEVSGMREAIIETMDRVAGALRAPFSLSCPDAPLEERLDRTAAQDRGYALAIFRAVMADAQRDPRIDALTTHPSLTSTIRDLISPLERTGQVIRPRAAIPAFFNALHPWHQDVVRPSTTGCGSVRLACWMPLSHVDERSGALEVIPGAWPEPFPQEVHHDGVFGIAQDHVPATERRSIALDAGDVLVIDRYLPHRSLPVEHGKARWAVAMWVRATTPA